MATCLRASRSQKHLNYPRINFVVKIVLSVLRSKPAKFRVMAQRDIASATLFSIFRCRCRNNILYTMALPNATQCFVFCTFDFSKDHIVGFSRHHSTILYQYI